ncbi:hypothetical protein CONPUDRAFT_67260, partial [Coniophora puteana RWD-64-598 SS2]
MLSSSQPVTTDTLPSNVPKLDPRGANWAIFSIRFQTGVQAKSKLWPHFSGAAQRPYPASVAAAPASAPLTAEQTAELEKWEERESLAKNLLLGRLPDSTVLKVRNLPTTAAMWAKVVQEYTQK